MRFMHVMVSLREHCSCALFQLPPAALRVTIMLPSGGQIISEEQMIFSEEVSKVCAFAGSNQNLLFRRLKQWRGL